MPQIRALMSNAIGRVLFVFNVLGLDAVVRCVDLGGIIDTLYVFGYSHY
jgi:hypothetical protein